MYFEGPPFRAPYNGTLGGGKELEVESVVFLKCALL
jgi:hypothetical protein